MPSRFLALALCASLVPATGCAAGGEPPRAVAPPAASATVLAARYVGTLPCPDCGGIYTELDLYVDRERSSPATYHLREVQLATRAGDRPAERDGRWREATGTPTDARAALVQLDFDDPNAARTFLRVGARQLRLLDRQLAEIQSAVPHQLRRADDSLPPPPRVVTEADAALPIELEVGQTLAIKLPSNRTAKYHWGLAETGLRFLAAEGMPVYAPERSAEANASGVEVWVFLAVGPGEQSLKFEYRRPWATPIAVARAVEFGVVVRTAAIPASR
ncbi:MAG: protease inhibitor I42 family protein [Thermoanaerobaculia bacterium]